MSRRIISAVAIAAAAALALAGCSGGGGSKSGDIDRDFAMMMRAHHQAGFDMAKVEAESGKNPQMVKEAKKIIASQQKDIQKFDSWLQKHPSK